MKPVAILIIITTILILLSGCVGNNNYSTQLTTEYTVKEKFQSTVSCGFGSGTSYNILTDDGEVIKIAGTCGVRTNLMEYYYVWSDATPGDIVVLTQRCTVTTYEEWFELRRNTIDSSQKNTIEVQE